jgi:apolipoprotein N-acyltransferase
MTAADRASNTGRARAVRLALRIAAVVATGLLLRAIAGPEPVWWLVWTAPVLFLLLGLTSTAFDARWMTFGAALIGTSASLDYFTVVSRSPLAIGWWAGMALLWTLAAGLTRRAVLARRSGWALFAWPAAWAAIHTLMAALAPDGDWGLIGYSQGDVPLVLQVAALGGVAAVAFLVSVPAAAVATAIALAGSGGGGWRGWAPYAVAAGLCLGAVGYGAVRLAEPDTGRPVTFGLMAIDADVGPRASPAYAAPIRDRYLAGIAALARDGAEVVVLPEKIAVGDPAQIGLWRAALAGAAEANGVWVEAGLGITDPGGTLNMAYLYGPDGREAAGYRKQFMAPPERAEGYSAGAGYTVTTVLGARYGLAVCKDMHFARLARAYGQRDTAVMLVPAWDFGHIDQWMGARMTALRGVEQGFAVARTSKEGLLSVSDAHGRILAEAQSGPSPGRRLLTTLVVGPHRPTLYGRTGNLFGWLCLALLAGLVTPWPRPRQAVAFLRFDRVVPPESA